MRCLSLPLAIVHAVLPLLTAVPGPPSSPPSSFPDLALQGPLVEGRPASLALAGADPGSAVFLLATAGDTGGGVCRGNACIILEAPIEILASASADRSGRVELEVIVPVGIRGVSLQAVTRAGGALATTDVVIAPVAAAPRALSQPGRSAGAAFDSPARTYSRALPPPTQLTDDELGRMLDSIDSGVQLELDAIWRKTTSALMLAIQRE
jgi:hypothetical protein